MSLVQQADLLILTCPTMQWIARLAEVIIGANLEAENY